MNLQEFVKTTLTEIMDGIREAQDSGIEKSAVPQTGEQPGQINPSHQIMGDSKQPFYVSQRGEYVHFVEFDIAVVAEESAEAKAGVRVLGLGVGGDLASRESSVSRVKFSVPVEWPRNQ